MCESIGASSSQIGMQIDEKMTTKCVFRLDRRLLEQFDSGRIFDIGEPETASIGGWRAIE